MGTGRDRRDRLAGRIVSARPLTVFRPEPRPVRWVYAVVSPVAMVGAVVLGVVIETVHSHRRARLARERAS